MQSKAFVVILSTLPVILHLIGTVKDGLDGVAVWRFAAGAVVTEAQVVGREQRRVAQLRGGQATTTVVFYTYRDRLGRQFTSYSRGACFEDRSTVPVSYWPDAPATHHVATVTGLRNHAIATLVTGGGWVLLAGLVAWGFRLSVTQWANASTQVDGAWLSSQRWRQLEQEQTRMMTVVTLLFFTNGCFLAFGLVRALSAVESARSPIVICR